MWVTPSCRNRAPCRSFRCYSPGYSRKPAAATLDMIAPAISVHKAFNVRSCTSTLVSDRQLFLEFGADILNSSEGARPHVLGPGWCNDRLQAGVFRALWRCTMKALNCCSIDEAPVCCAPRRNARSAVLGGDQIRCEALTTGKNLLVCRV